MKKNLLIAAIAITALASCTDETFVGEKSLQEASGGGAISFNLNVPAVTRADKTGKAAADDLNGKFYVWGIKNENTDGLNAAATGNLVYNNYVVEWTDNSAMTSTSNTEGWEYVGKNLAAKEIACITPNGETSGAVTQTIKYWDFGASDYTFYAFTADPSDLNATVGNAKVQVAKTTSVSSPSTVYDKGYSVTLAADANLDKLYFAERVNITASANTERTLDNTYGGNVTFRFHNMASKVRVAMYETIPGYKVTIDKFYVDADFSDNATANVLTFADMTTGVEDNFAANLNNCATGTAGTLTVTYDSRTTAPTHNYPMVSFDGTANNVLTLGPNLHGPQTTPSVVAGTDLGTDITHAVFDKSDKSYTSVFPMENNTQNLKLKVDYTLTAVDNSGNATTGETIKISGATAEIPAAYLKWKPGFAYTYIFKISDNTNGSSGQGVVGLYPITFDAVEVVADDGKAEYITTVSEPSITTFGVNSTGKYVSGGSEYAAGTDIYATIMDGSSVATPTLGTNVNLYKNIQAATGFTVTEASLAEAIAETGGTAGEKITYTLDNTIGIVRTGAANDGIPGEDGIEITGVPAIKMASLAAGTYAVEYIKSEVFTAQGYTYADAAAFAAAGTLYTSDACTNVASSWTNAETTYYKKIVNMPGTKVYKIIVVQ